MKAIEDDGCMGQMHGTRVKSGMFLVTLFFLFRFGANRG